MPLTGRLDTLVEVVGAKGDMARGETMPLTGRG